MNDNIGVTELKKVILNSMPNSWSRKAYAQGFDCEYITLKKSVHMFERIEISESIYEGVVEHSYKKPTRSDANRAGHRRQKRG